MPTVPENRALSALTLGNVFEELDVSAAVWDTSIWRAIDTTQAVMAFEVEHGVAAERERYNREQFERIWRSRKLVVAEHGGLSDIFAPIATNGRVQAALVTGPFARTRPTSSTVLERWRWLTGRQGHPSDPEFARFLDMTLATLVLDPGQLQAFRRVVAQLCRLIENEGSGVSARHDALRAELAKVRHVERMWSGALSLIDARTTRSWSSSYLQPWTLGIEQLPDQVLVGLAVNRDAADDPVDELVRRDAFQRACVNLARSLRHVVAGRVGTQGVMFLSALNATKQRKRQRLLDLADRLLPLARDFGSDCTWAWERQKARLSSRTTKRRSPQPRARSEQGCASCTRSLGHVARDSSSWISNESSCAPWNGSRRPKLSKATSTAFSRRSASTTDIARRPFERTSSRCSSA